MVDEASVEDSERAKKILKTQLDNATESAKHDRGKAKMWGRAGFWLSVGGAMGSALAGAAAASSANLSGALRTAVAIVAFLGAGLSGVAAGVRGPERAGEYRRRRIQLESLIRRLETIMELDIHRMDGAKARNKVEATLDCLDEIYGATSPKGLRLNDEQESDSEKGDEKKRTSEGKRSSRRAAGLLPAVYEDNGASGEQ